MKLRSFLSSSYLGQSDPVSSVSDSILLDGVVASRFGRRAEERFVVVPEEEECNGRDTEVNGRDRTWLER